MGVSHGFPIQRTAELADPTGRLAAAVRMGAGPGLGATAAGLAVVGRRSGDVAPGGGASPIPWRRRGRPCQRQRHRTTPTSRCSGLAVRRVSYRRRWPSFMPRSTASRPRWNGSGCGRQSNWSNTASDSGGRSPSSRPVDRTSETPWNSGSLSYAGRSWRPKTSPCCRRPASTSTGIRSTDAAAYQASWPTPGPDQGDDQADGGAVQAATGWTVNGRRLRAATMVRDFSKLMLRAYNAEADNLVRGAEALQAGRLRSSGWTRSPTPSSVSARRWTSG